MTDGGAILFGLVLFFILLGILLGVVEKKSPLFVHFDEYISHLPNLVSLREHFPLIESEFHKKWSESDKLKYVFIALCRDKVINPHWDDFLPKSYLIFERELLGQEPELNQFVKAAGNEKLESTEEEIKEFFEHKVKLDKDGFEPVEMDLKGNWFTRLGKRKTLPERAKKGVEFTF